MTSQQTSTVEQQTTPSQLTRWDLDPKHSLVEFSAKHMMVTTVKGRFAEVTGALSLDESDLSRSSVEAVIQVESIDTRTDQRDQHLRSADFLDAANFPTITFRSRRVEVIDAERLNVIGDLSIRGTTREVQLATTFNGKGVTPYGQQVIAFTGETKINRRDFGLVWNVALEAGGVLVGDTIKIAIEAQAVKAA